MPTPVAHTICGYVIYDGTIKKEKKIDWKMLLIVIFLANLPDIDYLPGLFIDKPNIFHHGATHSIFFAVVVGFLTAFLFSFRKSKTFWKHFFIFFALCFSHSVLDFFTKDTSLPLGEQLLWPFTDNYYLSPVTIFRDVSKGGTNKSFLMSAFEIYNFITVLTECIIFAPILIGIRKLRTIRHKKKQQ